MWLHEYKTVIKIIFILKPENLNENKVILIC